MPIIVPRLTNSDINILEKAVAKKHVKHDRSMLEVERI